MTQTSDKITLVLPFPPTLNHSIGYYGKRRYLTRAYKDFIEDVALIWAQNRPTNWDATKRYRVWMRLYYNTLRRYDVDDRVKPTLDALTRVGVWADDSQVDDQRSTRCGIDRDNPRAEVVVSVLDETAPASVWRD